MLGESSESSQEDEHLGRAIINPTHLREGPTISFDDDESIPFDDREMEGEKSRQRKKRVIDGGRGQLDFVPALDHQGFYPGKFYYGGTASRNSSVHVGKKRELEMSVEGEENGERTESEAATDSEEEELQRSLVPSYRQDRIPAQFKSVVIVPDSDEEDLGEEIDRQCEDLAHEIGGGGCDDSGFAEGELVRLVSSASVL